MSMLRLKDVAIHYPIRSGLFQSKNQMIKAVDGVNLTIEKGKTIGLVGESGSGKSTIGKGILGLESITSGEILYEEKNVTHLTRQERKDYYRDVQVIFQNSLASFNPRKRVRDILAEPLRNFEQLNGRSLEKRLLELIDIIGLQKEALDRFPHEFSGGQIQRIGIARAVATRPKLIIADEPVSALDLSIQAQVLNFMKDIQEEYGLSYLFISHDLSVVKQMCDELAIMYNGRFVEYGTNEEIYSNPQHIYTKRLLTAIPTTHPKERKEVEEKRAEIEALFQEEKAAYFSEDGRVFDLVSVGEGKHLVAKKA
jgi:peptide/nickel transport system ATP-binding protein